MIVRSIVLIATGLCSSFLVSGQSATGSDDANAPAEGKVVLSALIEDYWQLCVYDWETKAAVQLTFDSMDKRNPVWFEGGRKILYRSSNGKVYVYSMHDKTSQGLKLVEGHLIDPNVSPSGQFLAFGRFEASPTDNVDIFIYDLKGKTIQKVTHTPNLDVAPRWSPDGTHLAFVGGRGSRGHLLRVIELKTGSQKLLQTLPSDDGKPSWFPDGKRIVFMSSRSGDPEIWCVRVDTKDIERLTNSPGLDTDPCLNPQGTDLVFISSRDGDLRLWHMRLVDKSCHKVSGLPWEVRDPNWLGAWEKTVRHREPKSSKDASNKESVKVQP